MSLVNNSFGGAAAALVASNTNAANAEDAGA